MSPDVGWLQAGLDLGASDRVISSWVPLCLPVLLSCFMVSFEDGLSFRMVATWLLAAPAARWPLTLSSGAKSLFLVAPEGPGMKSWLALGRVPTL